MQHLPKEVRHQTGGIMELMNIRALECLCLPYDAKFWREKILAKYLTPKIGRYYFLADTQNCQST